MPRSSLLRSPNPSSQGVTLVELLLAVLITSGVVAALVNVSTGQFRSNQRAVALSAVERVISADLAWLRNYAQIWKLDSGPFNLTPSQTGTATYTRTSRLNYSPVGACDDIDADDNPIPLATPFLNDASSVITTPPRPQAVGPDQGTLALTLPDDAKGYTLNRTISIGANGNTIRVRYSLSGSDAPSLQRSASILIAASAWCF